MTLSFQSNELLGLIWRATWQSAVLALIALVLVMLTRPWFAPKWRVLFWTLPLLRLVLLVVPASSLSLFNWVDRSITRPSVTEIATRAIPMAPSPGMPFRSTAMFTHVQDAGVAAATSAPATPVRLPYTTDPMRVPIATCFIVVWFFGCAWLLFRWMVAKISLARLLAASEPLDEPGIQELIHARRPTHLFRRPIRCLVANENIGPSTCGLWRPTILLPRRLLREFNATQLQAVVRHELEHILRGDALLVVLSRLAVTMHWFNPLAYFVQSRLRKEMELAVDAATVAGLDADGRQSYGQLLIQLARQPVTRLGVAQMADRHSDLSARIDSLAHPCRNNQPRTAIALGLVGMLFLTGLSDVAKTPESQGSPLLSPAEVAAPAPQDNEKSEHKYFITGIVREQGTGKPIAGAAIQFLVQTEYEVDKRVPTGKTDAEGRYRIAAPLGNVSLWFPRLKPGYWLEGKDSIQNLVTSPEKPVVTCDIEAKTAPVWQVQAAGKLGKLRLISVMEVSDDAKRAALLNGQYTSWDVTPTQAFDDLDDAGRGAITQVGASGKLVIAIATTVRTELIVEPGFDNTRVVAAERLPDSDTTRLVDAQGKQATIGLARVTLTDGVPLLTFQVEEAQPIAMQTLAGRMLDQAGKPVVKARIGVIMGAKNEGNAEQGQSCETEEDGRFVLDVPIYSHYAPTKNNKVQFSISVTKNGFAATDSHFETCTDNYDLIDFGTITLARGSSQPVRVVDQAGAPLAGAAIVPGNGEYALRRQAVRSGPDGRAVLHDLPSGLVRVHVALGELTAQTKLVVSEDDAENIEATIRLNSPTPVAPQAPANEQKPLAVGDIAPPWDLAGWSDGQSRNLSDYRGQVLVIEFWGTWCGPCVGSIPAMKQLADEYKDRGVVFVGIHTADGIAEQINKLKKLHNWTAPSGIDRGTSNIDGATCRLYGVQGYPTLIIVDAAGKVAFNSDVRPEDGPKFMQEMEELVKSLGIEWPLPEDGPREELEAIRNKILHAMFHREIERVLAAKP